MTFVGPKVTQLARTAILPSTLVWAAANRFGWLGKPQIGDSPHLDDEALHCWRRAIADASVYLEYGSGGSTVEAAKSVDHVFSVETDGRFLESVEKKVEAASEATASFHPIHVDIGWTEKWGRPLLPWPSPRRVAKWRRYSAAPWRSLVDQKLVPDFIFIDGRFRAASALESLLHLPANSDCLLMVDDYQPRQRQYDVVLNFASDVRPAGRALLFRRQAEFDRVECARLLEKFQSDPE